MDDAKDKTMLRPWALEAKEVSGKLNTSATSGLSHAEAKARLLQYGPNTLVSRKKAGAFSTLIHQFNNPMVFTLLFATAVAFFLGEYLDANAILAIVVLNAVVGFIQENKANNALEELKKMSVPSSRVIREGKVQSISSQDVVPGDILQLEAGDLISADARIFESFQLTSDEAPLTGESLPVQKSFAIAPVDAVLAERTNMLFAGTAINSGSAKAIVCATGMKTEIGQIANLLAETEAEATPLQKRLLSITRKLILLGLVVVVIVAVLRYFEGDSWINIFMSAIGLAVAAIPEGLPTVITLALALAVRRMTRRNAIVRNLSSVETLGSTDVICTDKTGTLTTGIMSVREVFMPDKSNYDSFFEAMILCNNASLEGSGSGDTTEKALLEYAVSEGHVLTNINSKYPRIHEWSFDSVRKRMSVAVNTKQGIRIFSKGAPESMLPRCKFTNQEMEGIQAKVNLLTSQGKRVLALADKAGEIHHDHEMVEQDFHFLGLVALADPPRLETKDAIKKCKRAGIKVVMITGDHPNTALAIAQELGIYGEENSSHVLTGADLETLNLEDLKPKVEETFVYARVSPFHKLRIVEALQSNGHVVAMTGDGVNDAPALKKAQIGISMGLGGTEVARQASRIILTDDNFATIVSAVEEGRAIYGNIKRTIQYLFSTNFAEILIVLGSSLMGLPIPFTPIGLLWINLVTDGLPSLALAAEPLDKNILKNSRRPSPATFFDSFFTKQLLTVGLIMTFLCLGLYKYLLMDPAISEMKARSMTFALLIFMSLSISFACRSETKIFFKLPLNIFHLLSVIIPALLHLGIQESEVLREVFHIVPLSLMEIIFLGILCLIPPTVIEVNKLWIKHKLRTEEVGP